MEDKKKIEFKNLTEKIKKDKSIVCQEKKEGNKENKKEEKTTEVKKEEKEKTDKLEKIKINNFGVISASNLEEQETLARAYLSSGLLPKQFDTVAKIITAMHYAAEIGVPSIIGIKQICVINGSPSIWGDLPLALCEKSGKLEDIEEFLFNDKYEKICFENKNLNQNLFGACCRVKRKDRSLVEKTFTVDDAIVAGLLTKELKSSKDTWVKYPKLMMMYRARSMALKSVFPDILNGINIAEYDSDYLADNSKIGELSEEKTMLIREINELILQCRKCKEFNSAKENDIINNNVKNNDMRFAEEKDLQLLIEDLKKYIKENQSE